MKKLDKKEQKRDGTGPQSRRKRFHDPESEHGKQSLVYHAKHGALKDMVDGLEQPVRPRERPTTARGVRRREREQQATTGGRVSSDDFKQRMLDGQNGSAPPRSTPRRDRSVDSAKFESRRADASAPEGKAGGQRRISDSLFVKPRRDDDRPPRSRSEDGGGFRPRRDDTEGRTHDSADAARTARSERRAKFWEDAQQREQEKDIRTQQRQEERDSRPDSGREERPRGDRPPRQRDEGRSDSGRYERSRDNPPRQRDEGRSDNGRHDRTRENFSHQQDEGSLDISAPKARERSKGNMMPLTIKYTTAASQFLYGRAVVRSAMEQARRQLYRLYVYAGENRKEMGEVNDITRLAKKNRVPITIVPQQDQRLMDKMSAGRPHNGFVLESSPIPQKPVRALAEVEESAERNGFSIKLDRQTTEEEAVNGTDTFVPRASGLTAKPFVLLLDEIVDPGNLGAMLRTASYLGVDAVGITNRSTSRITPVVLKSAAGAVEEITIFSVDNAAKFLQESRKAGWRSYAAVPPPNSKLAGLHRDKFVSTDKIEQQSPLSKSPCILVLGNEGYGLSKQVKLAADFELSVPRFVWGSCIDSLNVSVATGLLCHSFVKKAAAGQDVADELPESEEEPSGEPVKDVMF